MTSEGIGPDSAGPFEGGFLQRAGWLRVPLHPRLESTGAVVYRFENAHGNRAWKHTRPTWRMLVAFRAADTKERRLAFVKRWGPLGMCECRKDASTCVACAVALATNPGAERRELLSGWDWLQAEFVAVEGLAFNAARRGLAGAVLAEKLTALLSRSGVGTTVRWLGGALTVRELSYSSGFGALVVHQLESATASLAPTCHFCSARIPAYKRRRRPKAGDRVCCEAKACLRERDRQARARWVERRGQQRAAKGMRTRRPAVK